MTPADAGDAPAPVDPRAWTRADLLVAAVPAALAAAIWLVGRGPDSPLRPAGAPAWARFRDHLLDGPDAGMWAANAFVLVAGDPADLDGHRLPLYPRLTALVARATGDVPLAGHLVAHLAHVALGAVVYLLGVRWMGRGMALGAALAAVVYVPAVYASERFGVDPLVALALPTALLAAELATRGPAWAVPTGVATGLLAGTHLTTLGAPAASVAVCLLRTPGGLRRLTTTGAFGAATAAGVWLVFLDYPVLPWDILVGTLAEGVVNGNPQGGGAPTGATGLDTVLAGLPLALERFVAYAASNVRPAWLPWYPALVLPWLGLLGAPPGPGRPSVRAAAAGLTAGIPLAVALLPTLAFAAAGAPERYTDNFHALVVLLVFRGIGVGAWGLEQVFGRGPWAGAAGVFTGLAAFAGLWPGGALGAVRSNPPTPEDAAAWRLGTLLAQHFPPGGGLACTNREAVAYAGRVYCPTSTGQKYWHDPEPARSWLAAECSGTGDVPYVVVSGPRDDRSPARRDLDRWVQANGRPVDELHLPGLDAWIYAVRR